MSEVGFTTTGYGGPGPETYENFFVPYIGKPLGSELIAAAALHEGERVLDVGCGTAIVARLARERIGDARLAGLDPNPGMLKFADKVCGDLGIEWHQASAESMPLNDESFDVVLSQMALQFIPDKASALREIARVLTPAGRAVLSVVGPRPEAFGVLAEALAAHINPESGKFVDGVFSLHDPDEIKNLVEGAGFRDVTVTSSAKTLSLPEPINFLWGYVNSTPLGAVVGKASDEVKSELQRAVVKKWQEYVDNGNLSVRVPVVVVTAVKA